MNIEKQNLIISYLVSDPNIFARCATILDSAYFDPEVKQAVQFTKDYYNQFRALPNLDQIRVETGVHLDKVETLTRGEQDYVLFEIEAYCRNKAMEIAILKAPKMLANGEQSLIQDMFKEAITMGLNKDLGLDYFSNPEERLKSMLHASPIIATGYAEIDFHLNGGISRKELLLLMAGSGVGKSVSMSNLAINFLEQRLNVGYISLELAPEVVAKRFDSMMTGVGTREIFEKMSKVISDVERKRDDMGKLFIKRLPESTTNANHIRAYLKEFEMVHGFIPDVLVIDYMDLMTSNQKISAENLFVKDKYVAEELRSIANDYDILVVTASQMNRSAIGAADIDQSNIAGGLSKINTCDNLIALIQDDAMKAAGEIIWKFVKTRNSGGVGKSVLLRWNPLTLRITNAEETPKQKLQFNAKETPAPKKDLLDIVQV